MALNLNIFDIIKGPVVSEKALKLNEKLNQLVVKVHPQANKTQIKEAVQQIFSVKVERVNTLRRKGKNRRVRRTIVQGSTTKKAVVTLKEGYTIDLFDKKNKATQPTAQAE